MSDPYFFFCKSFAFFTSERNAKFAPTANRLLPTAYYLLPTVYNLPSSFNNTVEYCISVPRKDRN